MDSVRLLFPWIEPMDYISIGCICHRDRELHIIYPDLGRASFYFFRNAEPYPRTYKYTTFNNYIYNLFIVIDHNYQLTQTVTADYCIALYRCTLLIDLYFVHSDPILLS